MTPCDTCKANRVCDHNRFGFENCGNYISADVVPRASVAKEIFAEINSIKNEYASGDIDGKELFSRLYMIEKKYTEENES